MKAKPMRKTWTKRRFPRRIRALRTGSEAYGEQNLSQRLLFAAENRRFLFQTRRDNAAAGFAIRNGIVQILRKFAANSPTKPNCSFRGCM
jgi:hypothetical protein